MDEIIIWGIPIEIWAIVAPFFGVLIGVLSTWMVSSRRINADLKAKTRLEWIKEVRELTAIIIEEHNLYLKLLWEYQEKYIDATKGIYCTIKKENIKSEIISEFKTESINMISSTSKNRNLFKLYFARIKRRKWYSPKRIFCCNKQYINRNYENEIMHLLVDRVYNQMYNFEKYFINNCQINQNISNENVISRFRNRTSDYLKKEWDRAKDNK